MCIEDESGIRKQYLSQQTEKTSTNHDFREYSHEANNIRFLLKINLSLNSQKTSGLKIVLLLEIFITAVGDCVIDN